MFRVVLLIKVTTVNHCNNSKSSKMVKKILLLSYKAKKYRILYKMVKAQFT